jgi:glycosyltransferase involved in cell wall biosynthesis
MTEPAKTSMDHNLVTAIYYHPEAYPPTLNAVGVLSDYFSSISIVHRPHLKGTWKYPANVKTIASGQLITARQQETSGTPRKVLFFMRFVIDLLRECYKKKPSVILLYDVHALFAYRVIRPLLWHKHILWYHNHDISELSRERKYSIGWFACKSEKKLFAYMDIFTLPSADRLPFFPINTMKGKYFIIPNYPSISFYRPFYNPNKPMDEIRLVFQGRIDEGHGLEEIISMLPELIDGKLLRLVLKGNCSEAYKAKLMELALLHQVTDRITFYGFTAYEEVPKIAATCHIGIGIFSKKETMHITLGTASNKIYEYAAVGLPVLYSDEPHFSSYLSTYPWAFPVKHNTMSIRQQLANILGNYAYYSGAAHETFLNELNFENYFKQAINFLTAGELPAASGKF